MPFGGRSAPGGWLLCDGSAVSRTTYASLFGVISPTVGVFTVTIAAPAVVSLTAHGFQTGDQVYLTTTGALPTGLAANTLYYTVRIDANSFNLSTTRANAYAGTKITTTGSQSGVHTVFDCPFGLGDGSTTFTLPDARGRALAGNDYMGGTAANRLNLAQSQGSYGNSGASGGEQGHQITTAELAAHTHTITGNYPQGVAGFGQTTPIQGNAISSVGNKTTDSTGSDTAHNTVQPTLVSNYIIKF